MVRDTIATSMRMASMDTTIIAITTLAVSKPTHMAQTILFMSRTPSITDTTWVANGLLSRVSFVAPPMMRVAY